MAGRLVLLMLCTVLHAAFHGVQRAHAAPSGFGKKKEPVPAIKSDMKYIKCEVCQLIAKQVSRSVADLRAQQPHWKTLSEDEILTHLESMCNTGKEEGEWITKLDVQQQGNEVKVVEMSQVRPQAAPSCAWLQLLFVYELQRECTCIEQALCTCVQCLLQAQLQLRLHACAPRQTATAATQPHHCRHNPRHAMLQE